MTVRPLLKKRLPELRRHFEENADAPEQLIILAAELGCRKTMSAKRLGEEVDARLQELGASDRVVAVDASKTTNQPTEVADSEEIYVAESDATAKFVDHQWDKHQRLIIECDEDEFSLVEAGPGSGKTAVACQRVAYLVEEKNLEASKVLLVSFTRAAIKELSDRIKSFAKRPIELAGLQIITLDSFTWQMLHGYTDNDAAKLLQGFEENIQGFVELLNNPTEDVLDSLEEFEHVIVDEAQDLVGDRADLMLSLIDRLPSACGVTIFADSAQAIYGFTTDQGADDPSKKTLVERLVEESAQQFGHRHLTNVYRTRDPQLLSLYEKGRRQLVGKSEANVKSWRDFRKFIEDNAHAHVGAIDAQNLTSRSDTLVLYRTRAEALMTSSMLWAKNIPNKLRMSAIPARVYPWIARVLSDADSPYMRQPEFIELWDTRVGPGQQDTSVTCEQAWQLLYDNVGQRAGRISLARLRAILGRDRPPVDFLVDERLLAGPVLGTIHASKGRESPIVHLMLPSDKLVNEKMDSRRIMEEQRVLFVGASRARERLLAGKGYNLYSRRLNASGRTYRMLAKNKGNIVQAEVGRMNDIDVVSVVDEDFRDEMQAAEYQNWLWECRNESVPLISKYDHDIKRNLLLSDDDDEQFMAAFSNRFSNDLWQLAENFAAERNTGRLRPASKINFIRQVGVRTAVLPEAQRDAVHSPWRESGFVLVPVISGFCPIYLNNWS